MTKKTSGKKTTKKSTPRKPRNPDTQYKSKKNSSVEKGLKLLRQEKGPDWAFDPKTRGVKNVLTGEKLSRRKFEVGYGLLEQQGGIKSFEQKANQRKAIGVPGFRALESNPKNIRKTYTSREAMLKDVRKIAETEDGTYIWRVALTGEDATEKYKTDKSGDITIYSRQLAGYPAEYLAEDYNSSAEFRLSNVKKWHLIGFNTNERTRESMARAAAARKTEKERQEKIRQQKREEKKNEPKKPPSKFKSKNPRKNI